MSKQSRSKQPPLTFNEKVLGRIDADMGRNGVGLNHSQNGAGLSVSVNQTPVMSKMKATGKTAVSLAANPSVSYTLIVSSLYGAVMGSIPIIEATHSNAPLLGVAGMFSLLGTPFALILAGMKVGPKLDDTWLRRLSSHVWADYRYGRAGYSYSGFFTAGGQFLAKSVMGNGNIGRSDLISLSAEHNADMEAWDGIYSSMAKEDAAKPVDPNGFRFDVDSIPDDQNTVELRRQRLFTSTVAKANAALSAAWLNRAALAAEQSRQNFAVKPGTWEAMSQAAKANADFFEQTAAKLNTVVIALDESIETVRVNQITAASDQVRVQIGALTNTATLLGDEAAGSRELTQIERQSRALGYQYEALAHMRTPETN